MFEYLNELDESIYKRYLTLEKNIEVKSNSYFDAWIDLYEQLLKYILNTESIEYDKRSSCGQLIRLKETEDFLTNILKYSENELINTKAYITGINDHKHRIEKSISIDDIYDSLVILDMLSSRYAKVKNIKNITHISISYYNNLLGKSIHQDKKIEELEERISKQEEKAVYLTDPTISDMIGEDFDEFYARSKIYTFQSDQYDLKREKRKYIINLISSYFILALLLAVIIYIAIKYKKFLIGSTILFAFILPITICKQYRIIKYPDRLPLESFYAYDKYKLYITMSQLRLRYVGSGLFSKLLNWFMIFGSLLFIYGWVELMAITNDVSMSFLYLFLAFFFHFVVVCRYIQINFDSFVFDADDAYVICDTKLKKFFKYDK